MVLDLPAHQGRQPRYVETEESRVLTHFDPF